MFRSPLKVYGEYLIPKAAAAASMTGDTVVRAGKGMSGLEVVVCWEGTDADPEAGVDITDGTTVTISLLHSQDGETFVALPPWVATISPAATFMPGEILARMTLPYDCLPYVKGNLAFSTAPTGNVSMFPAYLPR